MFVYMQCSSKKHLSNPEEEEEEEFATTFVV